MDDCDQRDSLGNSALHVAAVRGQVAAVLALLVSEPQLGWVLPLPLQSNRLPGSARAWLTAPRPPAYSGAAAPLLRPLRPAYGSPDYGSSHSCPLLGCWWQRFSCRDAQGGRRAACRTSERWWPAAGIAWRLCWQARACMSRTRTQEQTANTNLQACHGS